MKKILLSAYTSFNVGDDLFIKIICNRYLDTQFYLIAPKKYKNILKNAKNLHLINSDSIAYRVLNKFLKIINKNFSVFMKCIRKMDAVVIIGGSLFIEQLNWRERDELKIKKIYPNTKVFLLGANFGPFQSMEFLECFKEAFGKYEDVCFREKYSYQLFSKLNNVRMASDIVFSLNVNNLSNNLQKDEIAISVINLKNRNDLSLYYDDYIKKIVEICCFFQKMNVRINLISFCSVEGDEETINEINTLLEKKEMKKCEEVFYKDDLNIIIEALEKSKLIIATRFHAMILGWILKKNVVPIIYSQKMKNVIDDSKFKGYQINIEKIKEMDLSKIKQEYFKNEEFDVSVLKKESDNQFLKLDQFLNR